MGFEALGKIASYLGFPAVIEETSTKKAIDVVTPIAQSVLAQSKQDPSFFYCVLPPGLKQASKIMCIKQHIALQGFNELVASCQAVQTLDSSCSALANAQPYGQCGNRAICNLFYNGVINSCFDKALNATVPLSCIINPTTTPAVVGTNPWVITGLVLAGGVVCGIGLAATVCAVKYRAQIAELWKRCCMRCSYQKLGDAQDPL